MARDEAAGCWIRRQARRRAVHDLLRVRIDAVNVRVTDVRLEGDAIGVDLRVGDDLDRELVLFLHIDGREGEAYGARLRRIDRVRVRRQGRRNGRRVGLALGPGLNNLDLKVVGERAVQREHDGSYRAVDDGIAGDRHGAL